MGEFNYDYKKELSLITEDIRPYHIDLMKQELPLSRLDDNPSDWVLEVPKEQVYTLVSTGANIVWTHRRYPYLHKFLHIHSGRIWYVDTRSNDHQYYNITKMDTTELDYLEEVSSSKSTDIKRGPFIPNDLLMHIGKAEICMPRHIPLYQIYTATRNRIKHDSITADLIYNFTQITIHDKDSEPVWNHYRLDNPSILVIYKDPYHVYSYTESNFDIFDSDSIRCIACIRPSEIDRWFCLSNYVKRIG